MNTIIEINSHVLKFLLILIIAFSFRIGEKFATNKTAHDAAIAADTTRIADALEERSYSKEDIVFGTQKTKRRPCMIVYWIPKLRKLGDPIGASVKKIFSGPELESWREKNPKSEIIDIQMSQCGA